MSNRSYLVPRPPAFDHEHPRPKEEGEVLYCGNCSKWYVSWFPLTEVKTIWGRRPEWWIRIFHRKSYETIIQQIRRENEMKDSEADIAIGVLNKLIDQELEAVRAATRDGNTPFVGYAQTRHNAFLYARDEIRKALAAAVDERGAGNPFLPQRDELVTQDMHTCDLCGRWCSSPVYSIGLIYGGQAKTFTEVCADCMWRLKFSPVRTISLDAYRLFEQWRLSQSEADE